MNLRELIPTMRELGVRCATFSIRGDVTSAELFAGAPDVVPLPPLDLPPPLDAAALVEVGETEAPPEPEPQPAPPPPRPMDPGEAQAVERAEEKRQRERAVQRERAYQDSILFAASTGYAPSTLINENDEDDLSHE